MAATPRSNLCVQNSQNPPLSSVNNANDQFQATKIWNSILQDFYLGIELKKHKRNSNTYYDCFTATSAIDWLKIYLKDCEHFHNRKVTRFQAINLLRKYHKSSIIERCNLNKNHKDLQDNNDLYRFSDNANENLPFLTTSRSEADLIESCQIEPNNKVELNVNEKIAAYKAIIWEKIQDIQPNIVDFMKLEKLDGTSLFNNITRINANGVVQLADKTQDLPPWVLSAMKCLANWPKASGSGNCLPKYPGFEYDVFKLIRDYFSNLEEPIIPFELYKLILSTFDNYIQENASKFTKHQNRKMASFLKSTSTIFQKEQVPRNEINLPSNCVYETAFSGKEPVTKIVPIDELSTTFPNLADYFKPMIGKRQPFSPMNSSTMSTSSTFKAISTMPRNSSKLRQLAQVNSSTPQNAPNCQMMSDILCLDSPPESSEYMLSKDMWSQQRQFYSLRRNESRRSKASPLGTPSKNYKLLQLVLLTLPSPNRRHLQFLLRLFYKIIRNKELCLLTKDSQALKEQIVSIFTRCIFRCREEKDYNELNAREFVAFLIDECMVIFALPEEITKDIEKAINKVQAKKASMSGNYCQKISSEEFEMQRDVMSEVALSELMESIMRDESMSERDKLKWIKQFKLYHPEVYDIYFTNCSAKVSTERVPSRCSTARTRSLGSTILPNSKLVKRFLSLRF